MSKEIFNKSTIVDKVKKIYKMSSINKGIKKSIQSLKTELLDELNETGGDDFVLTTAYAGKYKISYQKQSTTNKVDVEKLKQKYPEIYKELLVSSIKSDSLTISKK